MDQKDMAGNNDYATMG